MWIVAPGGGDVAPDVREKFSNDGDAPTATAKREPSGLKVALGFHELVGNDSVVTKSPVARSINSSSSVLRRTISRVLFGEQRNSSAGSAAKPKWRITRPLG